MNYLDVARVSALMNAALDLYDEGKHEFSVDYILLAARHAAKLGATGETIQKLNDRTLSYNKSDIPDVIKEINYSFGMFCKSQGY